MKTVENRQKLYISMFMEITVAILIATVVSICIGKYPITTEDIWKICTGQEVKEMSKRVFFNLRLPRTIMGILAGAGLGLAGSVYQIIFKNPLASPDIIGIAGGANLGAAFAIVSAATVGMGGIAVGSFVGGFLAVGGVMLLVKITGSRSTATYVLAGIVINAISKAAIMALKYFADPENELQAMEFWEMGTLGNTTMEKVIAILPMFIVGFAGLLLLRRQIELMAMNDNECMALGLRIKPVRTAVLILSTLLVASVISVTGLISFAGLIAPHVARLAIKRNNSVTMLLSGFVGGLLVLGADILARILYSTELPISILTTIIGVPMLLYFMCNRGKGRIV